MIIQLALDQNTQFLRHYTKLELTMNTPEQCYIHHANEHKQQIEQKVLEKFNADPDSILGTYYRVNPELNSPDLNLNTSCNEWTARS